MIRLRPDLAALPAYKQGRIPDTTERVFKLSSNESPHGPLPSVVDAIAAAAAEVNRYPEAAASALADAVAQRHGLTPEHVVFGGGSVESVSQVIRAVAGPGDEVVYAWRSFEAYPLLVVGAGATPVPVPLTEDGRHDLSALRAAITDRTRLVILCTPNNPTGPAIAPSELADFVASIPDDVAVLIDEAYLHFQRGLDADPGVALLRRHPNVIVAHTFSKAHGLAGLRVGYALADPQVAETLRKVAMPFAVTTLAQVAALASLAAQDELDERVRGIVAERTRVTDALAADGWRLPDSQTNFIWFGLGEDTLAANEVFARHGLIVRAFPGEGLRVTIAEPEASEAILAAAAELAASGLTNGLRAGERAQA
ncbi:histidinol-phosphate transaminase [Propioniciclava soli]|uniref:Aromatic amino acid aminotransferase n=1 Tax=Propioniciclava soli TaxID=2775081 RepID=A0ABZ3C602_9ACTN